MNNYGPFSLDGRVALVTGASSGIGKRLAQVAAAAGAKVALVARRTERLEELRVEITALGGVAIAIGADVTDNEALSAAFDAAERALGTVDCFVANAGIGVGGEPSEVRSEDWKRAMETNLDAVFFSCQEAARRMQVAGKPGAIITIASVAGLIPQFEFSPYSIAKAAVIQTTRVFAAELGPRGIRVNCIAPGWIKTDMSAWFLDAPEGAAYVAGLPLGRAGGPEDLDGAFLLLASDAGRFMTGVTLPVDGGQLLRP